MTKVLKFWENETIILADYFVDKYFGKMKYNWVGNEIGGVMSVADYYFDLSDIVEFIRHHYSKDKMFEFYDYRLKCLEKGEEVKYNIKSYRHFN